MKMRVAFVGTGFTGGGAQHHFARIAPYLCQQAEYRIAIVLGNIESQYVPPGLDCVGLGYNGVSDYLLVLYRLWRILKLNRINLIYSISRCPNIVAYCASRLLRQRPALVLGENTQPIAAYSFKPDVIGRFWLHCQRLMHKRAEVTLCNSESCKREMVDGFGVAPNRVHVVGNPVPPSPHFDEGVELHVPPVDPEDILAASRLVEGKGLEELIMAFSRVSKNVNGRLFILGEGPLKAYLESMAQCCGIAERVIFPGWVENAAPWLRRAGLVVHPSHWEGLPNLVLEAMSAGVPVVATNCTSWIMAFAEERALKMVAVGDVDEIANAIRYLMASPYERLDLVKNGRRVAARFKVEEIIRQRDGYLWEAMRSRNTVVGGIA
jgi:glycosyltransferase involved in cell wall biosynthesis